MNTNLLMILISGISSGFIATFVSKFLDFRQTIWIHRRKDYGDLLIHLGEKEINTSADYKDLLRKIELVTLIGPKKVTENVLCLKNELHEYKDVTNPIKSTRLREWHDELLSIMFKEIKPFWGRKWRFK